MTEPSWDGIPLKGDPSQDENGLGHTQFREGILGGYDPNRDLKIDVWNPSGGAYDPTQQEPWQTVPPGIAGRFYHDRRPADGTPLWDAKTGKLYRFQTDRYVATDEKPEEAVFDSGGHATTRGYAGGEWFEVGADNAHPSVPPGVKAVRDSAAGALQAAAVHYAFITKGV